MHILHIYSVKIIYISILSGFAGLCVGILKFRTDSGGNTYTFRFLYSTVFGRTLLRVLTENHTSRVCGHFLSSPASRFIIRPFVRKNDIDLSEYESRKYRSFNDFFTRRVLPECRPIDSDETSLISPCDGLLSVYRIDSDSLFHIKGSEYDVPSLLRGAEYTEKFENGICMVFRLCVNNYHRYHYIDNGVKEKNVFLPGVLHTVRPIALEKTDVFIQNSREYTLMHTEHFGDVAQVEIGALLVGRIKNHDGAGSFVRGAEKGMFLYGGSTVVLLFEEDRVSVPEEIFSSTMAGEETAVRMGERIGSAIV